MACTQYWNYCQSLTTLKDNFQNKLIFLVLQFCRKVSIRVEDIQGILDSSKLYQQVERFAETMWNQFLVLNNPNEYGAITRLWTTLCGSKCVENTYRKTYQNISN